MGKKSIFFGMVILLLFAVPSVCAFESSGEYTENGTRWLNEHWGENITLGDLARIAYTPENYQRVIAGVPKDQLEKIWSQPYFWGSRHPWGTDNYTECPYGANVWNESGPVNINTMNLSDKRDAGLENAITDRSGCRVVGYMNMSVKKGELVSFQRKIPQGTDQFTIDLNWKNPENSLKLDLFGPEGKIGTYYDDSDGIGNGRIFLHVSRPGGIADGEWYAVVEGENVTGSQPFMFLLY